VIYVFENYSLDPDLRELRRGTDLIPIEPQVFDLLEYLIRNRQRVISKDDMIAEVWKGRIVSDSALTSRLTDVRQAVGDSGDEQRLIRTIARKGIRFVGEIQENQGSSGLGGANPVAPEVRQAAAAPSQTAAAPRLPDKPSIAVLPFTNMSGDPEQEYFSDGITADIITALSRLRWFFVIARNSTFVYKGQAVDIRRIGQELDVHYVLDGSVRKIGNRVRITVELIDTKSGVQHWAEKYDYELTDIFKLQDEITQSVTAAILPKLVAAEGIRSQHRSSNDLSAWDLVMRALIHYGRMTTRESEKAIEILRQAVQQYPDYGPAHSLLAFALLVSGHVGWIPESDDYRYAAELANRTLELDDQDPWAHLALGYLAFTHRQTGESVREYMRALDLNPNFAIAYGYLGWALVFDGQSEEAIRYFQQALRMSPHDPLKAFFYSGTCVAHYYAHRYDEAIEWGNKAIVERPGFAAAHRILCASLAQAGRTKQARAAMAKLREVQPNISIAWIEQHVPYTERAMPHFLDGMCKAGLE
jgi:TolB-like protein/tetratricopeptide (TPR) repeat protein